MITLINKFAENWFSWQVSMLWQVAILIVIVAAADFVLRRWAWPQIRYALWLLIIVKLILPPSLTSPASFTAEIPFIVKRTLTYMDIHKQIPNPKSEYQNLKQIQIAEMDSRLRGNDSGEEIASPEARNGIAVLTPKGSSMIAKQLMTWKFYVMYAWAGGMAILGGWIIIRLRNLRREYFKNKLQSSLPDRLEELLVSTARKLGLRKVPQVILTNKVCCPAVFGVFKPVLLLPADKLNDMTMQDAEHIFLHELAHIKRGDLFVHAIYMILQIVYWFNPLIWLARKPLQNLRELCCDATVAKILKERTAEYRQTLLETARQLLTKPVDQGLGLLGLFENSSWLVERLRWLEKKSWKYRPLRIATIFILICVMSTCVLPMTKFQATADFVVKGTVTDANSGKPIADAKVGDVNEYADGKFFTTTDANGDYSYQTYYEEHNIKCTAAGYKSKNETLFTKLFGKEKEKIINFELKAIEKNNLATEQHRE